MGQRKSNVVRQLNIRAAGGKLSDCAVIKDDAALPGLTVLTL